jgi:hypothetical protein
MVYRIRSLEFTEILDLSLRLYKENFFLFLAISTLTQLPLYSLQMLFIWMVKHYELWNPGEYLTKMILLSIVVAILSLSGYLSQGAIIHAAYRRLLGRPASILSSYREGLKVLWPLLFCGGFTLTSALIGSLLHLGIGLLLFLFFSLALQAVTLEGRCYFGAFQRSIELVKIIFPKTLLLFPILFFINLFGWINLIFLKDIILASIHQFLDVDVSLIRAIPFQSSILLYLNLLLLWPLKPLTTTLLYLDARIRREGFDIKLKFKELSNIL